MSSPYPSSHRRPQPQQELDLLHDALAELEARGVSGRRPLNDLEYELLVVGLVDRGAGEVIERGVRAGGIRPGGQEDAFPDLVQETWVKFLGLLRGLSLDEVRAKYPDHGQFAGNLWIAAKNRARDHQRYRKRAADREVPLILGIEEERGIPEEVLVVESRSGAVGTTHDEVDMVIDCRHLLHQLQSHAIRSASPQGQNTLARFLALMKMDFERVIQDGRLPDTDEACQELDFPSASTVSHARRRYREMAWDCFGWWRVKESH